MTCARPFPRTLGSILPAVLAVTATFASACTDDGGEGADEVADGEDGTTGGDTSCSAAGSEPGAALEGRVVEVSSGASEGFGQCSSGWATDAPAREPEWAAYVGQSPEGFVDMKVEAYPGGGAVVLTNNVFARFDGAGELLWSSSAGLESAGRVALAVEPEGTILAAYWSWEDDSTGFERYDGDGNTLGAVEVAFNSPSARVWGIERLGEDLMIACEDEGAQGFFQSTLLRVNPMGEVVLRKGNPSLFSTDFAVTPGGQVLFSGVLLSAEDGGVFGNLTPSTGNIQAGNNVGEDFVVTVSNADFSVGRYSTFGTERWLQGYDRAGNFERALAVAGTESGELVAVGSVPIVNFENLGYWYTSEPQIIATDADGNALWADRVAMLGEAMDVAIGEDGAIYVVGGAEGTAVQSDEFGDWPVVERWIRRYAF